MSASSTNTPTYTESTKNDPPLTTNANVPPVVRSAEDTSSTLTVATNTLTPGMLALLPKNLTAINNVPRVVTETILLNPVVLPNCGVDLALSAHRNGRRGLGKGGGFLYGSYQRRPIIIGFLGFSQK